MNDYSFSPSQSRKKRINSGILVGVITAIIMIFVHLFFMLIFSANNNNGWIVTGDWFASVIQLFAYFFAAQSAAQRQYNNQERDIDALRGVRAAGIGAAITICLLVWIFIIIRAIIWDATGVITVVVDPVGLFCQIPVDFILAIGLGAWGGRIVEKKYKPNVY